MGDPSIRTATDDDAPAMAVIYNHAVLHTTATFDTVEQSVADRRGWLASDALQLALVAEAGGSVIGWASLWQWSPRAAYEHTAESSVYVASAAQRCGVGRALCEAALEAAPAVGLHVVVAQVCAENAAALALAGRFGFARVGTLREVGFKFGRWLDVVVLQRFV
jgi:phosphinothricin acetyltransferase